MNLFERFLKIYRDKSGWIKVKTPETEYLNSRIYFDYKELSDLYEYASNKNFKKEKTAIRRVVNSLRLVSELDTRMLRRIIAQLRNGLPKVFRPKKCFDVLKN
jgi:hypothetical protein